MEIFKDNFASIFSANVIMDGFWNQNIFENWYLFPETGTDKTMPVSSLYVSCVFDLFLSEGQN